MPLTCDPEIALVLRHLAALEQQAPAPAVCDVQGLREASDAGMVESYAAGTTAFQTVVDLSVPLSDVQSKDFLAEVDDGSSLELRWYTPARLTPAAGAVVYLHGGGMISGSVDIYDPLMHFYVALTGVPFLSVEYRLAPNHVVDTPVKDCWAGLNWLRSRAEELGIDPDAIAVMGDSAGGGLAAGLGIMARDTGTPLAGQILIYPMLDDRTSRGRDVVDPPACTWPHASNRIAWDALLPDALGQDAITPYVAPGRLSDFTDLPAIYIEVGDLDIFYAEALQFVSSARAANVSTELHLHAGAPHGYEWYAPGGSLAARAMRDRQRVIIDMTRQHRDGAGRVARSHLSG